MTVAGQIIELWRYPVSSLGGESITRASLSSAGLAGDRQYGLIDARDGSPATPEKQARWRPALHLRAAFHGNTCPIVTFPDGRYYAADDRALNQALTEHFGFEAAIAAYAHTERRAGFPLTQYRHPHFPLHLLTTASMNQLGIIRSSGILDSRRFRPTVLIETDDSGFVENDWIGRQLRLGTVVLTALEDTKRCGVTLISQPGLAEDPEILRNIVRHNQRNLGIYCRIEHGGPVALGDKLVLET